MPYGAELLYRALPKFLAHNIYILYVCVIYIYKMHIILHMHIYLLEFELRALHCLGRCPTT
jgi:hypothetical protein